jgi:uncharacterized membrane protein
MLSTRVTQAAFRRSADPADRKVCAMDWDDALPWAFLLFIAPLMMAIRSIVIDRRLKAQIEVLTGKVAMLDHRLFRFDERLTALVGGPVTPAPEAHVTEPPGAETSPIALEAQAPRLSPATPEPRVALAEPPAARPSPPPGWSFEQRFAERWLVWLGGVTLALGGAFLVKLSIDYGLLTPPVRVILAVLLGIGLCAGAEFLARREPEAEDAARRVAPVPQALGAAGSATIFAALYAGYQLYGLIPATLAFPLLAATSIATVALSLRHGVFVAALGLVGAYAVPALVTSDAPHALPLFAYLAFVTAGLLAVMRHRRWWGLAWPALAAAYGWTMVWLALDYAHPETPVVGAYILVQLALFAGFRRGVPRVGFLTGIAASPQVGPLVRVAYGLFATAAFVLVHVAGFDSASLVTVFAAAALMLGFAYRDRDLDDIMVTAAVLLLAVLASWHLPLLAAQDAFFARLRLPVAFGEFTTACVAAAALLGGGGFVAQMRAPRPGRWAGMSVIASALIVVIAYWRLHPYGLDIGWSTLALVLSGLNLAAAASVARRRNGEFEIGIALAAYAIGVLGGTILAATFALSTAWLTVAIALHLPAIGWVEGRINLKVLRWVAAAVAGIVLVRLALNPYALAYPMAAPILNWLLYGYGVPALAFIVATRQFGGRADDLLVRILEAGSLLLTTMLLTFELRHALYGRIDAPLADLAKDALDPLLWLLLAGGSLWLGELRNRVVLRVGGIILVALASAQIVLWQVLADNPMVSNASVGRALIFDVLSLAYFLPAAIYVGFVILRLGPQWLHLGARILAVGLVLVWLTLEIRHSFQGEFLAYGLTSDAEWYTYSAVWLVFAGIGLAIGLIRRDEWLRRVSLAGVTVVIAKVFLSDMSELEGVYRALSFLGLGGALIGIGYAYRRLRPAQAE